MSDNRFGDGVRVVCARQTDERRVQKGMTGTLKKSSKRLNSWFVEFDIPINGHNASGEGKERSCLWFHGPRHPELTWCEYRYCLCQFDVIDRYKWRKL